jgi:hypothetical protein
MLDFDFFSLPISLPFRFSPPLTFASGSAVPAGDSTSLHWQHRQHHWQINGLKKRIEGKQGADTTSCVARHHSLGGEGAISIGHHRVGAPRAYKTVWPRDGMM